MGKLKKEDCQLRGLVEEVIKYMQFEIDQRGVEIQLEDLSQVVQGERGLLFKVFENLISNSLKYSTGKQVLIRIGSRNLHGLVQCYVSDNGIGIAKDQQDLIFKIFKTLDQESSSSGVGLSIVKKIVALHHGEVSVESSQGNGTTISFTIGAL